MYRTLPNWYGKVDDELRRQIMILADKQNIRIRFISDSKTIDESVNNIMNVLLRLKEEVIGKFDEETIKHFKEIEEGEKEKGGKETPKFKVSKSKKSSKTKTTKEKGKRKATADAIRKKSYKRSRKVN